MLVACLAALTADSITTTLAAAPRAAGVVVYVDLPSRVEVAASRSLLARIPVPIRVPAPTPTRTPVVTPSAGPQSSWLVRVAACIRREESGGDYTTDTGNGYYGAYQFSDSTWHAVSGLPGHASDYPPSVQDYWFMRVFARLRGDRVRQQQWGTWRSCAPNG